MPWRSRRLSLALSLWLRHELAAGTFSDGSALHSTALGDQHRRLLLAVASDEVYRAPNDGRSGLWACYRLGDVDVSPAAAASVAPRLGARALLGPPSLTAAGERVVGQ